MELLVLLLIASIFVSFETSLIILALILLLSNLDEEKKKVYSKVATFLIGLTIFGFVCNLIVEGAGLVMKTILDFINIINCYLKEPIIVNGLQKYAFSPIDYLLGIFDNLVSFIIILVKFLFVIALLNNKDWNKNKVFCFIECFVDKLVNYVNKN